VWKKYRGENENMKTLLEQNLVDTQYTHTYTPVRLIQRLLFRLMFDVSYVFVGWLVGWVKMK
jgi:hypothetical protein